MHSFGLGVCVYKFAFFGFFFFFFFHAFQEVMWLLFMNNSRDFSTVNSASVYYSWTHKFHFLAIFFIKNEFYSTIHIFKNYFVTVFSISIKISSIQTDIYKGRIASYTQIHTLFMCQFFIRFHSFHDKLE